MTATYSTSKEIYSRNYGSERLYKRGYCNNLNYAEGIMDFANTLSAHWLVDNVISYMPKILEAYIENDFTFFVVEIALNQEQQGYMEIYTEDYVQGIYNEHISIVKQDIPFIDLPTRTDNEITSYKFFLELSSINPVIYTMLLISEKILNLLAYVMETCKESVV